MTSLSKRLYRASLLVEKGSRVLDIGCDHAYLPIYLIKEKISTHAYALDNKIGPLNNARENVREEGLEDEIDLILSDGFRNAMELDFDTVTILGMGGTLIRDILKDSDLPIETELILGPNNHQETLREYLIEAGYQIIDEDFFIDSGKYYQLIKAKRGNTDTPYSKGELMFGRINISKGNEDLRTYLRSQLNTLESSMEKTNSEELRDRIKLFQEALNEIERNNPIFQ